MNFEIIKRFLKMSSVIFHFKATGDTSKVLREYLLLNVAKAKPFKTENSPGIFYHWFENKFCNLMELKTIKKWRLSAGTLNWLGPLPAENVDWTSTSDHPISLLYWESHDCNYWILKKDIFQIGPIFCHETGYARFKFLKVTKEDWEHFRISSFSSRFAQPEILYYTGVSDTWRIS